MSDEKGQPKYAGPKRALIEVVTENGFCIARSSDLEKTLPSVTYEYLFIVRAPNGEERNVTVEFSDEAIAIIQRRRRIPLRRASSFWINCAEHCLATYLAEKNHLPPGVELIIEELCLAELEAARLWDDASDFLFYLSTG